MNAPTQKPGRKPTRYQEILQVIRKRIFEGIYAVGATLPSEAEFGAEFGASRFTIREALRRLQADGLVRRQQGAGSVVIRASSKGAFVQTYSSISELLQFALDTDYRVLSVDNVRLDDALAANLVAERGEAWTRQRGMRLDGPDGAPLALIESYVPPRLTGHAADLARQKPPFYAYLEQATGEIATEVLQEVQALAMPDYVAEALGAAPGDISLRLFRRYESAKGPLIASFNWHLGGDEFIYRTRLKQQDAVGSTAF